MFITMQNRYFRWAVYFCDGCGHGVVDVYWRFTLIHAVTPPQRPSCHVLHGLKSLDDWWLNHATRGGRRLILTFLVTVTDAVTSHSEQAVGHTSSRVTCIILFGINKYRYLSPFYRFIKGTRSQNFGLERTYIKI